MIDITFFNCSSAFVLNIPVNLGRLSKTRNILEERNGYLSVKQINLRVKLTARYFSAVNNKVY